MSVFVAGSAPDSTPQTRCRKKYETKYSAKYEEEYQWVRPSAKGETYALCDWCSVDICIKSVGAKGLRDHEITGRHKQKASDRPPPPPPPPPPQLTNAVYPVLEVEEVVEHQGGEVPSSPRPVTPQTPNTPLSPQGEDLPQPPPPLLDFAAQLPASTSQVGESLVIEYDNPGSCNVPTAPPSKSGGGSAAPIKRETEEKIAVSTDDLTCNVCGREYTQWTQLKRHLLDHILIAQESADIKAKGIGRGRGRAVRSKTSNRAGRTSQQSGITQQKQDQSAEKTGGAGPSVRRRGRARGGRSRGRGAAGHPLPPRRTPRTRAHGHTAQLQEEEVDDPLYREETQGHPQVVNTHVTAKDFGEEDVEEGEECGDEAGEASGCEGKPSVAGKRKLVPLQCRVCRLVFFNRVELKEHQQTEHNNGRPYQCDHCHKFFTTKNHMEVHIRHKHSFGPNPCQCSMCGKVLSSRTNLRIHMRIHKGERPFECRVCRKTFSRKANMEMHLVYHTGERRFTCEICGQSFFAINALKRHTKLHTGERDYACEICGATYVTGTDLRRHRLKHNEVKPFPCQLCDKQFTRSHDLKVHLRYHNKELRYTCDVCNKQFVESGNYKRHMRRHTGERPYTCGICLLTFSQVHHLKTHMRTNHLEDPGGGEEEGQGDSGGRGRVPPHRNPRLPLRRNSKPTQMPKLLAALTHGQPHPHPHLPSHPHPVGAGNGGGGGVGVGIHSGQPISPPMAHSSTAVVPTHTTQIQATTGVNHPGFIHSYNSHIYNHGVMPHYPTLYDVCQPQNSVSHIQMH